MALNNFKLLSLERGESIKHLAITKNPPFIEWILNGRDDRIRTCDPLVPSEVRYQAALHPEKGSCDNSQIQIYQQQTLKSID